MRRLIAALIVFAISAAVKADEPEPGFRPLFDGKSLAGWEGDEKVFRVEDGAAVAGSLKEKIAHNDFLCTKEQFGDFELRLQARLVGKGQNAGIQLRSERVPNHFEVSGYQCDMGVANGKPIWGWLYDESRRKKFLAQADADKLTQAVKTGGWNDLVIRCQGPRVQIWVNGLATVDYTEADEKIARRGLIGLQIHGGEPAEAAYRKIRVKEL
ncbi:MAG: DUF1080 domain-containing protein [Planctomycetaceae bacterium]|nr:DUF1080 domain-containing protein [Planctomycetaceae bacterium]